MTSPILFIDGSGQFLRISLKIFNNDQSSFINRNVYASKKNNFLQEISKLLWENQLVPKDLSHSILVSGPGSFTGLRVTGLLAKSISYLQGINFFAISKFDLLFYNFNPVQKIILLLVKKSKNCYKAIFVDKNKNKISSFFDVDVNDSLLKLKDKVIQKNITEEEIKNNLQIEIENSFDEEKSKKIFNQKIKYSFDYKDYFKFIEENSLEEKNHKNYSIFY